MDAVPRLFWQASLAELKKGYLYHRPDDAFVCLICGTRFSKGIVYAGDDGLLYEAEKYMQMHIKQAHQSAFHSLLNLDRKLTGLTTHQKRILELFYGGFSDREVAEAIGTHSTSTVRNHRFNLREKQKQAKVFLAIMELLEERPAQRRFSGHIPHLYGQGDERYAITEEENEKILAAHFKHGPDGPLASFPRKEKKRVAILRHLVKNFEAGRTYTEKEVNDTLRAFYDDYALLRRCLIDYGLMNRTPDGRAYWTESAPEANYPWRSDPAMDRRKELKRTYKETPRPMGVYQIKNQATGKVFLGSSMNLPGSLNSNRFQLNMGSHRNQALQADWKQYGPDAFSFDILETINPEKVAKDKWREAVAAMEQKWLDSLQPYGERGYHKKVNK